MRKRSFPEAFTPAGKGSMRFVFFSAFLLMLLIGCTQLAVKTEQQPDLNADVNAVLQKPLPDFSIVAPKAGEVFEDLHSIELRLETSNLKLGKPDTENAEGEGHFHVWLDVAPEETNPYLKVDSRIFTLTNVSFGSHKLIVELRNNDHSPYVPAVRKEISFVSRAKPPPGPPPEPDFYKLSDVNDFGKDPAELFKAAVSRLTDSRDSYPSWSPDGKKIAFLRGEAEPKQIVIIDSSTGSEIKSFDSIESDIHRIAWAPDSKRFAFSVREGVFDYINIFDIESGSKTNVSPTNFDLAFDWGKDDMIYYIVDVVQRSDVYHITPDGENKRRVTNNGFGEWDLRLSPNGTKILFTYKYSNENIWEPTGWIYVMNKDSTGITKISSTVTAFAPEWHSSGEKIFYLDSNVLHSQKLDYSLATDPSVAIGTGTQKYGKISSYSVSPDGTKMAYSPCKRDAKTVGVCILNLSKLID